METINLEGRRIQLARVEGTPDVFNSPNFVLVKARLARIYSASSIVEIPLPQLGVEEPERVCEICRPVTELVTKSRSPMQVAELGGIQTLIALSKAENQAITGHVASALQILSMHQPLHKYLAHTGAIKALCHIINQTPETSDFILTDAISALMIYCKSQELKTKALEDGVLEPVLKLCTVGESNTVSLMAVSTLSHIVEHPGTHDKVVESRSNILTRLCALTGDSDEQRSDLMLSTLINIWIREWVDVAASNPHFTLQKAGMVKLESSYPAFFEFFINQTYVDDASGNVGTDAAHGTMMPWRSALSSLMTLCFI
ncbi:hypothetical protein FSP39_017589 [Pinctada imbricata]|uniref:Uncharacterized protein n=1 Tax=Pinctada imbricata TaxID=66713 RepID=A0AA88Y1X0_PINIB|nr:hypothetical protein FSP39_017589 [Pinctada imbricata]